MKIHLSRTTAKQIKKIIESNLMARDFKVPSDHKHSTIYDNQNRETQVTEIYVSLQLCCSSFRRKEQISKKIDLTTKCIWKDKNHPSNFATYN